MKIEIVKQTPKVIKDFMSYIYYGNSTYYDLTICVEEINEHKNKYQKIYYGTIERYYRIGFGSSQTVTYNDTDIPERLKVAVELMLPFLI